MHPPRRTPATPQASSPRPQGPAPALPPRPRTQDHQNRLHLDLSAAPESTRDQETQRLIDLGATLIDDRRAPDGTGWTVLTDPEGNEFCVVRAEHER
ncbi:VOC family protein [Nocardiopsis sp. CNR-923]|uniref:VOC family protein n=1 Tax=Nocardiopsis sp. CNR-923 TaxID=1904965 RepID=UPI0013017D54|nr:VOC family protein [Nocardiopsis sp. CNR-923]